MKTQKLTRLILLLFAIFGSYINSEAQPQLSLGAATDGVRSVISARWRGFNNAAGGSAAMYLGNSNIGSGGVHRVQYATGGMYLRPGNNSILFSYDKPNNRLIASINGNNIFYNNVSSFILGTASLCRMNYMNINLRNTGSFTGQVSLTNISLNGNSLPSLTVPGGGNLTWNINNYDFSEGFTLTGTIVLDAGSYGGNENAKVDMIVGEKSPVTSTNISSFCDGGNADLTLSGLLPGKNYTVSYDINGSNFTSPSFLTNSAGSGSFAIGPLSSSDFGKTITANIFSVSGGCNWAASVNNTSILAENSSCIILPVTGLEVRALRSAGKIIINWKTLSEINTSHFLIESSTDGRSWEKGVMVASKGGPNRSSTYEFIWPRNHTEEAYFRIKIVDKDGRYAYSKQVKINAAVSLSITLTPNPAVNIVRITLPSPRKLVKLKIIDRNGRTVFTMPQASTFSELDMSAFPPGVYLLRFVLDNGETQIKRLVKQ